MDGQYVMDKNYVCRKFSAATPELVYAPRYVMLSDCVADARVLRDMGIEPIINNLGSGPGFLGYDEGPGYSDLGEQVGGEFRHAFQ